MAGGLVFQYMSSQAMKGEDPVQENVSNIPWIQQMHQNGEFFFQNMATICISAIVLYLFGAVLSVFKSMFLMKMSKEIEMDMCSDYYQHLVQLSFPVLENFQTGDILSRFADIKDIRRAVSNASVSIVLDTGMSICSGMLLFMISRQLFFLTFGVFLLYVIITILFAHPMNEKNLKVMSQGAESTSFMKESVSGITVIKSCQYEDSVIHKFKNLYSAFLNSIMDLMALIAAQNALKDFLYNAFIVIFLWVGVSLCINGNLNFSDLLLFYYMLSFFLNPLKNLLSLQPDIHTAIASMHRLQEIMNLPYEDVNTGEKLENLNGMIEFKDVSFSYHEDHPVLKHISAEFPIGSKVAIVGTSGCGKTTLIRTLMRYYPVSDGEIKINGQNINAYSIQSLRSKIAYISQDIFLFHDTVYNNLRMNKMDLTDQEIENVCKMCDADAFIQKLPNGYHTVLSEDGQNLSGGEKQRLAIVRALLQKTKILVMDEATSRLDSKTESEIKNTIQHLPESITCIIIAHRLSTIKDCDYIYVMHDGKIQEEGTHNDLMCKKGMYYQSWTIPLE